MRKALFLLLMFSSVVKSSYSQNYILGVTLEPFKGGFTTDYLGNIFRFTSGDVVKYDLNGNQTGIYSSREYGDISYVDATNPMKVLVVFNEFSKAIVLDNSMSANISFNLMMPGIPHISLICTSRDAGYWIFDPQAKQLKKLNEQFTVTIEGTNLRQVTDSDVVPQRILDSGNWVILFAENYGYLIFDRYGTYYKTIKTNASGDFQVSNDEIVYKEGDKMIMTDIKTGRVRSFLLPENSPGDKCRVESKRIYIQQLNSLKIYSF